jgi:hypothetical protein
MMKWINFLFLFLTLHTVGYSADMDPRELEDRNRSLILKQGRAPISINPLETQAVPSLASSGFFKILNFEHILHITSFLSTPEIGVLTQTCKSLASDSKIAVLWRLAAQVHVSTDDLYRISHPVLFRMSCLLQSPSALGVAAQKVFQEPVPNIAPLLQLSIIMYFNNPESLMTFYSTKFPNSLTAFTKQLPPLQPHVYFLISKFPVIAYKMLNFGYFRDIVDLSESECEWVVDHLKSQDNLEKSHMDPPETGYATEEVFDYILSKRIKDHRLKALNDLMNLIPASLCDLKTAIFCEFCDILISIDLEDQNLYLRVVTKLLADPSINEPLILKIFPAFRTLGKITSCNYLNRGFLLGVQNILATSPLTKDIVSVIEELSSTTHKDKEEAIKIKKKEAIMGGELLNF